MENAGRETVRGVGATIRSATRTSVDRYRALGNAPDVRRLLAAAAGSYIGDRFNTIALIALSFKLGDSALGVGGMLALMVLPRLLVQGMAGSLVDRYPGKRLLVLTQLAMAVVAGSFALLAVFPSLWLLYGLTLAMAIVRTVDMPAFEKRLMVLTPREQRGTANAVHMLAMTAGEIVGPLLGGIVLALAGTTPLFVINALTFMVLVRVTASLPDRIAAAAPWTDPLSVATSVPVPGLGYRMLMRRSDVRLYVAMIAGTAVLILGAIPLFISRAHDLGLDDGAVGLFYATMGVGSLIGGMFAGAGTYLTRRSLAIAAVAGFVGALGLIGFGFAGNVPLALGGLIVFGLIADLEEVSALTYFQHALPEAVFGRFFSLFLMATGAGGVIGSLGGPALAEVIGIGTALAVLAVPVLVVATIFGVREGGLRLALPPFAPILEPEVVGHGLFGVPSQSDLLPDGRAGGAMLTPRLHRLV
ncbi:MAG: MFS transporter [Chloroflexia bacterium]|nr:MFS transporter [Chloroflexia bacterium]